MKNESLQYLGKDELEDYMGDNKGQALEFMNESADKSKMSGQ